MGDTPFAQPCTVMHKRKHATYTTPSPVVTPTHSIPLRQNWLRSAIFRFICVVSVHQRLRVCFCACPFSFSQKRPARCAIFFRNSCTVLHNDSRQKPPAPPTPPRQLSQTTTIYRKLASFRKKPGISSIGPIHLHFCSISRCSRYSLRTAAIFAPRTSIFDRSYCPNQPSFQVTIASYLKHCLGKDSLGLEATTTFPTTRRNTGSSSSDSRESS